ncbi:MAG: hypothetical protein WCN95_12830, partial [bacterium]
IGAAWWGKVVIGEGSPLPAGNVTFATASDDGSVVWVDRDQNGLFEHAGALGDEMIVNNKGSHGVQYSYGVVNLPAGTYNVAMGFYEGGGGEYMEVRYGSGSLLNNWGGMTTINPSAAGQNGLWKSGGIGLVCMTNIPISVTANSSISASSGTNVAILGSLTLSNGVSLRITAGSPLGFLKTVIPAGVTAVGLNAEVDTYPTMVSGVDCTGAAASISKIGPGRVILTRPGINLGDTTFNIQTGALVAVHSDAFGASALQLSGGELILSSPGGNITYANALSVTQHSTLTAGRAGYGAAGPLTNTLSGDINFTGSQSLTNRATDSYTLRLSGQITGNGTNILTAGNVILDDPAFNAVILNGGALTVYSNLTVNSLVQNSGTFTMAGSSRDLTVVNTLTLAGPLNLSGGPTLLLSSAAVILNSGASLIYDQTMTAGTLTLNSGATLNLGTNALNVGTLTLRNGGSLITTGQITSDISMRFWPQCSITNLLSGTGDVYIGEPEDSWGYVSLAGLNDYTGKTQIRRAVLRADEGVGLPTNSLLVFNAASRDQPCVLETSGAFGRNIGQNAGEVYWGSGSGGGFSARGGSLVVALAGNAALDWSSGTTGFNNLDALILGSDTADSMVELTNPINLEGNSHWLSICNNPNVKTDFARLSGNITGNGAWNSTQLRFNENSANNFYNSLIELTGTNTYSQRTLIDYSAVYAVDGVGLPENSLLYFEANDVWEEAILLSQGTFNRKIGLDQPGQVYWGSHGGFAARGGPLTVSLEDGAVLSWADGNTGFNGQWLQMNSQYADNKVEITNPIEIWGDDRAVRVFDNLDTDQDVAVLSGVISGSNHGNPLRKSGPGTLWLTGANTFQQYLAIDMGTVRVDTQANLSAGTTVTFVNWWTGGDWPKTLESKGALAFSLAGWNDAGKLSFEWGDGGFSAYGGPLAVTLQGGATIPWDTLSGGFNGRNLHLGSHSANNAVTIINTLDAKGGWRQIRAWGNRYSENDYAVISNMTSSGGGNNGHVQVYGDGILKFTGNVDMMNYLRVEDNAKVLINGIFTGNNLDSNNGQSGGAIPRYRGWGATPTIGGNGTINANEVRLRGWSPTSYTILAPGDGVGTLNANVVSSFVFENNYVMYEWELGSGVSDKVAVTGNLWMGNGWNLKLLSAGGTPRAADQYVLLTYSGTCTYAAPAMDFSAIPADWRTNGVQVIHDTTSTPKRIYVTGLYSVLSVANDPPTGLTSACATLNGRVSAQGATFDINVYWSTNSGGTNAEAWLATGSSAFVATVTNVIGQSVSYPITGLLTNVQYYYTYRATNQTMNMWAVPSQAFNALGPPVVTNTMVSDFGIGSGLLGGMFKGHNRGEITFCWGAVDGGTVNPSSWQYSTNIGVQAGSAFSARATELLYGGRYVYRIFAVNPYGSAWSDPAATFTQTFKPIAMVVSNNLAAHFDAAKGIINDGNGVYTWADQSGNGHIATRTDRTMLLAENQINGMPAVQFRNEAYANISGNMYSKEQYVVVKIKDGD